jgi:hypothetical protein
MGILQKIYDRLATLITNVGTVDTVVDAIKVATDKLGVASTTIAQANLYATTSDLEAATKTIAATSQSGTADYSSSLTIASSLDAKCTIIRIATRLSVTIDSDDGTHDLRCRVYVDDATGADADHLLFDQTYSSTGNQLAVQDCLVGTKEHIFDLLKNGSAHTFYFFFWSPGNHSPVISVVQAWEAVGVSASSPSPWAFLQITETGELEVLWWMARLGSGTSVFRVWSGLYTGGAWGNYPAPVGGPTTMGASVTDSQGGFSTIASTGITLAGYSGASTDLLYLYALKINARDA